MSVNNEIREMLIQARADAYDGYQRLRQELLNDERVPDEAITKLVEERNRVWDEFTSRINKIPVD